MSNVIDQQIVGFDPADEKKDVTVISAQTPLGLLSAAVNKCCDIATIERLEGLYERDQARIAQAAYNEALTKFGQIKQPVKHNRKGKTAGNAPFSYADYPSMVKTIAPWMTECGLSFSHRQDAPVMTEKGMVASIMVYCKIQHIKGHFQEFPYPAMPDMRLDGKVSPSQLIQLAITYAKRQTLAMGLGLSTEEDKYDDDSSKPEELITEEQAANLQSMIDEIKDFNKDEFYKWISKHTKMEITELAGIPKKHFKQIVSAMETRRKGI